MSAGATVLTKTESALRVRLADPFLAPRQRVNRGVTVPHLFAPC